MSELEKEISPFTVKDAIHAHDRRLNELSDEVKNKTHETQIVVREFEKQMSTILERINKGVSPTMQEIKEKSNDIDKSIISLKGDMNLRFAEVAQTLAVRDVEHRAKFEAIEKEIDNRLEVSDEIIRGIKWLFLKILGWGSVAAIGAFISMWIYIQTLKTSLASIPTAINMRSK